jgi:putative adhesin
MAELVRKVRLVWIVLVLACGVGTIPARGRVTEEFHHTYPLNADGRVSLENVNGNVHVSAWDRNEVKVDAIKYASDEDRLADVTIEIDAHSASIHIKTRYPHHLFNNNPGGVEYTLTVPHGARLDKIDLVNGSLDIDGVTGDLRASLVNGNVKAHATRGGTELSTVNGRVELTVDESDLRKSISLSSVNGSLVLNLPPDVNARLNASSVTGGINCDFQIAVHGWFVGHSLEGELGHGGPEIHLSDVNGRISIRRASQVTN